VTGKTYYEILNLSEGATKTQIKKSYRKLVKLYHPDVSDDPNAHEKYLEISQAYEALLNPQKKHERSSSRPSSKAHKWNEYKRESRRKHAQRQAKKAQEIQLFYQSLRRGWRRNWIRMNLLLGLLVSIFTIADQISEPSQRIVAIAGLKNYSSESKIHTEEGDFTVMENEKHSSIRSKTEFILFESKYLKQGLFIAYLHEGITFYQRVSFSPGGPSFYWGYEIVLLVSLIPLFFYVIFRKNSGWFVFFHYFTLIVTTPWLIYFIVQHPTIIKSLKFGII
tara:strand:+ start:428 stop:1264 length:837 start_codon:yes stop_codon:yes gene_type:complete